MRGRSRGGVGDFLRREGADPSVEVMFYRVVTQVVLLFGSETWVLLEEMERNVEGIHTGFLSNITRKLVRCKADGIRVTPRAEVVQEAART